MRTFLLVLISISGVLAPAIVLADTSDIQSQIAQHNAAIQELDQEISQYQAQLNTLGTQKQTLQTALQSITVTSQQTATQIKVTQNKIQAANLQLQELSGQITAKQYQIELDKETLANDMRAMQLSDETSLPEQLLSADTLANAWFDAGQTLALDSALQSNVATLSGDTADLQNKQATVSGTKDHLTSLNDNLSGQQQQLTIVKNQKSQLLAQTKSKESTYQALIAEKKAQQAAFEAELSQLQASLKSVSAGSVPASGAGILAWPFSTSVMGTCPGKASALGNPFCITQYFGNTDFSTANPQVYNGMGHDGLDIGVPIGTPVEAAMSGTVLATGNTDVRAPSGAMCYSFGKWVMLQHPNGLDTLYAHLSVISVTKGQPVTTGQVIGNSGETGYATGPHLHFGVYAGAGVQIMDLGSWRKQSGGSPSMTPCTAAGAILPVAPVNAYLNPLSYLPK